jgi:DNA-binding transcriptional regulator YiaG
LRGLKSDWTQEQILSTKPQKPARKPPVLSPRSELKVRSLRDRSKLRQQDFWEKVGVSQSGGSRYESGRTIPQPVMMLLTLAHGTEAQAQKMLEWLRSNPPK